MKAEQKMSAGSAYKAHIQDKEAPIVEVKVPSGFVFEFRKPGIFGMLFSMGSLPQSAASDASLAWIEQGVLKLGENEGELSEETIKKLKMGVAIVERVMQLSHKPKLVSGAAENDNELSISDIAEEDLQYLFQWVANGGDLSAMLGNFPSGRQPDVMASASRKKQRHSSK